MKKLLLIFLFSLPALAGPCPNHFASLAYPAVGCTVATNNWSWVYPDSTNFTDITVGAWHRNSFDNFIGRMITYQEVPGETTFSYELFSYGWQTTVAANPWIHEFTNNDAVPGGFSTASMHVGVASGGIAATDTTINAVLLGTGTCASTGKFFASGYLRIDDEIVKYSSYTCLAPNLAFTIATRGARGTTAVCHNPTGTVVNSCATVGNGSIWQGAPDPQFWNRATGAFTASAPDTTPTIEGGHPWHQTAFDNTHERWIRFDGKPEVSNYQSYTEFYNFNSGCTNGSCVPANASAPTWTILPLASDTARFLANSSGATDVSTDGALEYDGFHDAMMQFGGGTGPSNITTVMCFNAAQEANVVGCPTTGGPNSNGTNVWGQVTTTCYAVGGATWSGSTCNGGANQNAMARKWQAIVWDSNIKRYVMFGGGAGPPTLCMPATSTSNPVTWNSTNCPTEPNDVYIYNPEDASWRQVILSGDIPAPTRRTALTYDSSRKVEVLWEGPITYDASGNPWVGRYESGIYKLAISNVPANGVTTACGTFGSPGGCATGVWTIQGATGCVSGSCASGPPQPYSQSSVNSPTQGCSSTDDLFLTLGVPSAWAATHAYSLNNVVYALVSGNYYLQEVTTAGTSGGTPPTWSTTTGGTTTDGTVIPVTWTNKGIFQFNCDHASQNIVYDSINDGYIYEDIDTSTTGTYSRVQVWQIPASAVTTSSSPNPPSAPTLSLTATGNAQVSLSWTASSGATSYTVYKCTATCGAPLTNFTSVGSTGSLTMTVTGLTNGTLYTFVVEAFNSNPSPPSNAVTATPAAAADVQPSPTSLTFGTQPLHTTSGAQSVTLTNPGGTAVTINSFAITGDFAFTNVNCPVSPSTLAASASCTINITFTPTNTGTRNGTFTITDTGTSSPQSVSLSGTGGLLSPSLVRGSNVRR